jgi:hypothetical protein
LDPLAVRCRLFRVPLYHPAQEGKDLHLYVLGTTESFQGHQQRRTPNSEHGAVCYNAFKALLATKDYTMCGVFHGRWCSSKHEDVFARGDLKQDVLWRFNVPWSERTKVLKLLDSYNLNAFSLFDSEESLMETLALRELEFREKNV